MEQNGVGLSEKKVRKLHQVVGLLIGAYGPPDRRGRRKTGRTIRLVGHMRAEHIEHARAELTNCRGATALDLNELTLADVEAVRRFLVGAERSGGVRHCAPFIREGMAREADRR